MIPKQVALLDCGSGLQRFTSSSGSDKHLYYKRVDPYLCSELAPVLEGSGSHRRYPRKGTSVDRVSVVFVARVDRQIFLLFVKNGFVVGVRLPKVTGSHLLMARPRHCLSAAHGWALPTQYPVQLANTTHTVYIDLHGRRHAGRQRGAGKERGRMEGARDRREGGSDDVRQGGSGSGGREG